MNLHVLPSCLNGELIVPGSKSHSIRALAIAAMAEGESIIRYPLESEDTFSGMNAVLKMGAEITLHTQKEWRIRGNSRKFTLPNETLDLGNSGTSLRIFTALAALAKTPFCFDGDASLRTRVMAPLTDALKILGASVESTNGKCPLTLCGPIHAGHVRMRAPSSQFLTALLLAAPLIPQGLTIIDLSELNEKPYVEITLDWLRMQKIEFAYTPDLMHFEIPGGQHYAAFERLIPADFSTATFPLIAALITRSPLSIRNLDFTDSQGDKAVFGFAREMGAGIETEGDQTLVIPPKGKLRALPELDLNSTPDALPAFAALACFAEGTTRIINTPQARIKETDRIACMSSELRKMGAIIEEFPDGMSIASPPEGLHGARVNGFNDHRIVMALAIAGLGAKGETIVSTAEAAAVTYPHFISDFQKIGAKFRSV